MTRRLRIELDIPDNWTPDINPYAATKEYADQIHELLTYAEWVYPETELPGGLTEAGMARLKVEYGLADTRALWLTDEATSE